MAVVFKVGVGVTKSWVHPSLNQALGKFNVISGHGITSGGGGGSVSQTDGHSQKWVTV